MLVEGVGNLESNTAGSMNITASAAFPNTQGLVPAGVVSMSMGCSVGKISPCQVHADPEIQGGTPSLWAMKVAMTTVLGSTVTSAMADRVADGLLGKPRWPGPSACG